MLAPQSLEAEQAALGACLIERDAIAQALELLKEEDFYREHHKKIYKVILKLFDRGEPVDVVTVSEDLRRSGQLEECGGGEYLVSLMEACPSSANVEAYGRVVQQKSILRQLISASEQIKGWAYQPDTEEVHTLVDRAEKKIFEIGQKQLRDGFTHIKPLLMTAYDQIERQFQHKGDATGIPTGFYDLDNMTSGLQPADLIILAARPSMGKTALALNIAHHVALKERHPVAVFSLEMSKEQLVQRLVCSQAEIKSQDLRRGRVQDSDWHRITNAVNELYQANIFIDDSPNASTFEMRAKARRLTAEYGQLGLIVIDYLQLAHSSGKSENRVNEISEISRAFKSMARELKCPIIALSQLSRSVEQREDKRPMLSDLRESGSIEADADIVMFIYRASYYRRKAMMKDGEIDPNAEPDPDEGVAEVIIGKHRNGPVGAVKLAFQPEYARFGNLVRDYNGGYDD
ncbi:replicative DNA helicase [bacterium]|nr:MAG: replicative DNA helicase [bacterium]